MFSRSSLHWDSFSGLYSVRFHSNGTLRFARAPGSVLERLSSCYRPSLLTTWGKNLFKEKTWEREVGCLKSHYFSWPWWTHLLPEEFPILQNQFSCSLSRYNMTLQLAQQKKINNLISERLRPPPRQNSYGKEPKKWPSLINSVTHSFMQR